MRILYSSDIIMHLFRGPSENTTVKEPIMHSAKFIAMYSNDHYGVQIFNDDKTFTTNTHIIQL